MHILMAAISPPLLNSSFSSHKFQPTIQRTLRFPYVLSPFLVHIDCWLFYIPRARSLLICSVLLESLFESGMAPKDTR